MSRRPTTRCRLTTDVGLRRAYDDRTNAIRGNFPAGLSRPALRALVDAGISRLDQLTKITEDELLRLHGMGPKALRILRDGLRAKGFDLRAS